MSGRMWQMTKWGSGDWWLVSNDRRDVYRFRRYEEDGTLTAGNSGRPIVGTFWQVMRLPVMDVEMALLRGAVDGLPWDGGEVASLLRSRAECVSYVEEIMDRQEANR